MTTVLVTGASGFIGRRLAAALAARGCHVRCLVRRTSSVRTLVRAGAELCYGDVTDPASLAAAVSGAEVVYHAAGLTSALRLRDLLRVNGDGCWNVARACAAEARPPVLVYLSSLAAAGPARRGTVRTPDEPPAPVSDYGRSKRAGERAVAAWAHRVPTTVVRPGVVFGPGNRQLLDLYRSIAAWRLHVIPSFSPPPLSLLHVDELIQILLLAAEKGARIEPSRGRSDGRVDGRGYYFACVDEYPTWLDLGHWTARALGYPRLALLHFAEPYLWLLSGLNGLLGYVRGQPPPLNVDKIREALVPSWASSPDTMVRDLSFAPAQTVQQRWQETVAWYLQHRWLPKPVFRPLFGQPATARAPATRRLAMR